MTRGPANGIYRLTRLVASLFIVTAFIFDRPNEIFHGMRAIIASPSNLVTDYVAIGGAGAALLNSGLITLISLLILKKYDHHFAPSSVLHLMLLAGYSFWGKNLFNAAPIIIGLLVYMHISHDGSQVHLSSGLLGTALAPAVSIVYFSSNQWYIKSLALGLGFVIGFVMVPLFERIRHLTFGLNIYNMGFVAGIASIVVNFLITKILHIEVALIQMPPQHAHELALLFSLLFLFLFLYGCFLFFHDHFVKIQDKKLVLKESGAKHHLLRDVFQIYKFSLYGLIGLTIVFLLDVPLTGAVAGSIMIFTGFSAYHYRFSHYFFPALGVSVTYQVFFGGIASESGLIALFFVSTMAPFCHLYGTVPGFFSGLLFPWTAKLLNLTHNGINLYNSGFAGGITVLCLFLLMQVPFLKKHPVGKKHSQLELRFLQKVAQHIEIKKAP